MITCRAFQHFGFKPALAWLAAVMLAGDFIPLHAASTATEPDFFLRTWDVEDGLPSETVNAVAQTPDHFLWVATRNGLARFDGLHFKRYSLGNSATARDNNFIRLLVDRSGALWTATESGVLARVEQGRLQPVDLGAAMNAAKITALVEDRAGALWIATDGKGVARWQAGIVEVFNRTTGLPTDSVLAMTCDDAGMVWLGAGGNLMFFQDGHWVAPRGLIVPRSRIETLTRNAHGGLWAGVSLPHPFFQGAQIVEVGATNSPAAFSPYPWLQDSARSRIHAILEDASGTVWVGTEGGGVFYHPQDDTWRRLNPDGLLSRLITTCLFEDRDHLLWIGTEHGGLSQVRRKLVATVTLPESGGERLITTAAAACDGSVWIGTDSAGVFCQRAGEFAHYDIGEARALRYVNAILEDSQTNLWVGTWGGLLRWRAGRFEPVSGPAALGKIVMSLLEDRAGNLWVGSSEGLVRLRDGVARVYGRAEGLKSFDISGLAEGPSGELWVAVRKGGLYRLANDRFEFYSNLPAAARQSIRALHCDPEGTLWIATFGEGLFCLRDGKLSSWTMADGLPNNTLKTIIEDSAGRLWLSSDNGIFGISKRALADYVPGTSPPLTCRHLSLADGLVTRVASGGGQPVVARSADGRFWFPTGKALAVFNPAELLPNSPPQPVRVEEVWVDGVAQPAALLAELSVPSRIKRLEFRYTAPHFMAAEGLRFRHRLEEMDNDWVDAGAQRTAAYSQLPPGNYVFRVMAGSSEGGWREAGQAVRVEVVPRLWQRRWFQGLALLLLVGAVAAAVRTRERAKVRRRLRQIETKQALENERRRIARDLHDDIGANVWQLTMLGELAGRKAALPDETRRDLENMVGKTRNLARALDETIWAVNPRNDTLSSLVAYLQQFGNEFFDASPIRFRMDAPSVLPDTPLSVQVRHNIFLVVKEALHNAASYSGATEVWLRIQCAALALHLAVEDDGCGFDPAQARGGNGLGNMRERLQAIGGEAEIESQRGRGCRVRFRLPLPPPGGGQT